MRCAHLRAGVAVAALAAALGGCALKAPPSTTELQKEALPHTALPPAWIAGGASAQPVAERWLASFDDPALTALVGESLAYNADLQVAAARVEQAGGYLKVASGSLLPSVGVAGVWSGASGSGGGLNGIFLNASLELDVWGRLRYGEAAAQQQLLAVQADYAYARQSLAATVAKSWFVAIEASLQLAIVRDTLHAAETLLQLAQERLRVGIGNEQAVADAQASVSGFRDTLRQTELSRVQALRALELLLGRYPAAEIAVAQALSQPPKELLPPPIPTPQSTSAIPPALTLAF